ncbi:GNAT family N-acetyltransferase [Vagococcus humatus]|uniref:GNAT family N-acetyltransferase n=2 Tax=Vagococcus humatus TaxID=1889241 RepID=A0A3S0AEK5_9ENTE|nr:GNAT family N-acetyltransferase [Vagococcus humatus]
MGNKRLGDLFMNCLVNDNSLYQVDESGHISAAITYHEVAPNVWQVDKTFTTSNSLRNQRIVKELVAGMVTYARKEHKKIVPKCPQTKRIIDANPTYQDVL